MFLANRRDYICNAIAGIINASESVVMMMLVTRYTSVTDAGYLTVAFAIGNLLATVGKYGMYSYQVTDTYNHYSDSVYYMSRIITTSAMLVALALYLLRGILFLSYPHDKTLIVLCISLIYAIEAMEDLYRAYCQRAGMMYIGSIAFIARWLSILIAFSACLTVLRNTTVALVISTVVSIIVFIISIYIIKHHYLKNISCVISSNSLYSTFSTSISLLKAVAPIFTAECIAMYVNNAPKLVLEKYTTDQVQACYGFVAMPVFVIGLLNSFIYQPQLIHLKLSYDNHREDFGRRIIKQLLIIVALTIACTVGASLIGIPVLSWVFHTDLSCYRRELIVLVLTGGFLAVSGYQSAILTIMRCQKYILYGYIPVAIITFASLGIVIKRFDTLGAALGYLSLMILLCILYGIVIIRSSRSQDSAME